MSLTGSVKSDLIKCKFINCDEKSIQVRLVGSFTNRHPYSRYSRNKGKRDVHLRAASIWDEQILARHIIPPSSPEEDNTKETAWEGTSSKLPDILLVICYTSTRLPMGLISASHWGCLNCVLSSNGAPAQNWRNIWVVIIITLTWAFTMMVQI